MPLVSYDDRFECHGTPIHEIQGAGHRSPLEGLAVERVCAVVTARRRGSGWIEARRRDWDGVAATSEAMALATSVETDLKAGDFIAVGGIIEERAPRADTDLPTTTIRAESISILARNVELPPAIRVGRGGRRSPDVAEDDPRGFDPERSAVDFYESLEGMLVSIRQPIAVSPSRAGHAEFLPDRGHDIAARTISLGVYSTETRVNPERVRIVDDRLPTLRVGDVLDGEAVGALSYDGGGYFVEPTEPLPEVRVRGSRRARAGLVSSSERFTVATYNAHDLAFSDGPRMDRLANDIVYSLGAPDILALQEVQDDNGTASGELSAERTLQRLAEATALLGGPRYEFSQVSPDFENADGGAPDGNIRPAFLFKPGRVHLRRIARLVPGHPAWSHSRKPLVGDFCVLGKMMRFVNVHLVSRLGDDPLFGVWQPPRQPSNEQRLAQATLLAELIARRNDAGSTLVVLGDFNDPDFGPSSRVVEAAGATNLVLLVPPAERYTYNYEGNSFALDQIFLSPAPGDDAAVAIAHLNADLPDQERASDHDPVVAQLVPSGPTCSPPQDDR